MSYLTPLRPADVAPAPPPAVDAETLAGAARIVDDVRAHGEPALRRWATELDGLGAGAPLVLDRDDLARAAERIPIEARALLERVTARVSGFARAQRACLTELDVEVEGGRAGHSILPLERAGCYVPGGRYPLPSSAIMTAATARAAGVREVWVASPRPADITLAAAHVAGADRVLTAGGAQAIAALAHGAGPVPAVDFICGPGNRWVTAAKQLVFGAVGVDMLAGPSELCVLADESARPDLVAADLLAQAEHDPDARPYLVTTDPTLPARVEQELARQLAALPTAATAAEALSRSGAAIVCDDLDQACATADRLAPEHLELHVEDPGSCARRLQHAGALFLGAASAEVLGDYGAGPNHVLPTGGCARRRGGLSVLDFCRVRSWLAMDPGEPGSRVVEDAERLGRLEGLAGHAASARIRSSGSVAGAGPPPRMDG